MTRHTPRIATGTITASPHFDYAPALHNSGPGTMAVYRTGAVGLEAGISAQEVIDTLLQRVHITVSRGFYSHGPDLHLVPLLIDAAACAALVLLSPRNSTDERELLTKVTFAISNGPGGLWRRKPAEVSRATARLDTLHTLLHARSLLPPFHGIARWRDDTGASFPARAPWIPDSANAKVVHLAWQLLAIAHLSPPVLLFSRPASLEWFRQRGVIQLRWFGTRPQEEASA